MIHVARGGTAEVLALAVIVCTVRGTLEAGAIIAEGDGRAQVYTALIEGQPAGTIAIEGWGGIGAESLIFPSFC